MGKRVLGDMSQEVVDALLDGMTQEERLAAVEKTPTLPDKNVVADYLVERLATEKDVWRRAWSISALAAINKPDTVEVVVAHMDPQKEDDLWVRYWATIALAKMQPPDLEKHLTEARQDEQPVRAVALRLLVENNLDKKALDELIEMIQSRDPDDIWAACKVLRRTAGHQPFREAVEKRFTPCLVERLLDPYEWMECRVQAAMALGDVKHNWRESMEALAQAIQKQIPNDWVRRECVGALARIKRPEVMNGLLYALRDSDAEIRARAAKALKDVLGVQDALAFIAQYMLTEDKLSAEYLNALREIDAAAAASTLSSYLLSADPKMSERALHALAMLGGEEAIRTLQVQRTKALDKYTEMLDKADADIVLRFNSLMQQARMAFRMSMSMHGIIFAIGVLVLAVSAYMALKSGSESFQRYVGVGGAASSLGVLLTMFYKNPLSNIQNSVTDLAKVNVVFLGYVRQMNQIDATFKQLFLASAGFGLQQMKDTVQQIQDSVKQTLEQVRTHLTE